MVARSTWCRGILIRTVRIGCIILSAAPLLQGCSKQHNLSLSAINACQYHCRQQLNECKEKCDDGCIQCLQQSFTASNQHYFQFIHQQVVQGGGVARDLKSYRDPLQCLKSTCNCHADYYQCSDACTGTIHKRLQSPMTCR
jgi:hypothetical protein